MDQQALLCECHDQPLFFNKDKRSPAGGYWICRVSWNEKQLRLQKTPGTYAYNQVHGIGKAGERARENQRERGRREGSFLYNRWHGIGDAGELSRGHLRKRRARLAGVESEEYTRAQVYERASGRCQLCDLELERGWHVDHVVPLAAGGPDTFANVQATCPHCNLAKGTRTAEATV